MVRQEVPADHNKVNAVNIAVFDTQVEAGPDAFNGASPLPGYPPR